MATNAALSAGLKLCEPLICVGLKAVLQIPEGMVEAGIKWVKERFTDHSLVFTKAVATAHDRAWQAVALALATDTIFSHVANLFRDGDLKAVQSQIGSSSPPPTQASTVLPLGYERRRAMNCSP